MNTKTKRVVALCVTAVVCTLAFAKKAKNKAGRPELIDYKGQTLGGARFPNG